MTTKIPSKSYKEISSFGVTYTGGPIRYDPFEKGLILPNNGGLLYMDLTNGQKYWIIENDQENADDFDFITSFAICKVNFKLIIATRSGLLKCFDVCGPTQNEMNDDDVLDCSQSTNLPSFKLSKTWKALHKLQIVEMEIDKTGTLLATGAADGSIRCWDIEGNFCTNSLPQCLDRKVSKMKFILKNENTQVYLAHVGEMNVDLKIDNFTDKHEDTLICKQAHASEITILEYYEQEDQLISLSRDAICSIWKFKNLEKITNITLLESINSGFLLNDNIFCVGESGKIHNFDIIKRADKILNLTGNESTESKNLENLTNLIYNKTDDNIVITDFRNDIFIFDKILKKFDKNESKCNIFPTKMFPGQLEDVLSVTFINDNLIAIGSTSAKITLVELSSNNFASLHGHSHSVLCLETFQDEILISGSKDQTARIWSFKNSKWTSISIAGHVGSVTALATSKISKKKLKTNNVRNFATGSDDNTIKFWSFDSKTNLPSCQWTIHAHDSDVNDLDFSPNDKFLISAGAEKVLKMWNTNDGSLMRQFIGHNRALWSAAFSPTDQVVASCASDGLIKLWSLDSNNCLASLEGHEVSVLKIKWSKDGKYLISVGSDGIMKIWSIKFQECINTLEAHDDARCWALANNFSDNLLITGGNDGIVKIWKENTENLLLEDEKLREKKIMANQNLENFIHEKKYENAIKLAIILDRPKAMFDLLVEIDCDEDILVPIVEKLSTNHLDRLLKYTKCWNYHSKRATIGQRILNIILSTTLPGKLSTLPQIDNHLPSLLAYTERHVNRIEKLSAQATFMDFICQTNNIFNNSTDDETLQSKNRFSDKSETMVKDTVQNSDSEEEEVVISISSIRQNLPKTETLKRKTDNADIFKIWEEASRKDENKNFVKRSLIETPKTPRRSNRSKK